MWVITISSFKGGTAKTSTSLHIGAALARHHKQKVLLIDFDAQANLTSGFGYDPDAHDSLASVLQRKKPIEEVILKTSIPGLSLIPADTWLERIEVTEALAGDRYSHERLKELLKSLKGFDTVIIDTPPSLCWLTESALIASQFALVTATPEFYSVKGLQRLSQFLTSIGERHTLTVLGIVLSFGTPAARATTPSLTSSNRHSPARCSKPKSAATSLSPKPLFTVNPSLKSLPNPARLKTTPPSPKNY